MLKYGCVKSGKNRVAVPIAWALAFVLMGFPFFNQGCGCRSTDEGISRMTPEPIMLSEFAAYAPIPVNVEPSLQPYTPAADLSNVKGKENLSQEKAEYIAKNYIVMTESDKHSITDIYDEIGKSQEALFVTSDAVLHAFHVLFDMSLRRIEASGLMDDLKRLTTGMIHVLARMEGGIRDDELKDAALKSRAFFCVGARVLGLEADEPAKYEDLISDEVELINAQSGIVESPLFGYEIDYSQFKPRGHYTRNDEFENYFKAMMWYGKVGFRTMTYQEDALDKIGRDQTRQALLITGGLFCEHEDKERLVDIWARIYGPTSFLVGYSDDLGPPEYSEIMIEVYGRDFPIGDLSDDLKLDEFRKRADERERSLILSDIAEEDDSSSYKGFRFMGQRHVPDSHVLQELVNDPVKGRLMPRGLDVPAVFGSLRAKEILLNIYSEGEYEGYENKLNELIEKFGGVSTNKWTRNIYWCRLYSLNSLVRERPQGYPSFMLAPLWRDKSLNTYLGSWAQLKHDTVLYSKQSTMRVTNSIEAGEVAYVEPDPEFYARLAATVDMMRRGFKSRNMTDDEIDKRIERMHKLLLSLKDYSEKELRGEPLTAEEMRSLRLIADDLSYITGIPEDIEADLASETDSQMALIVDVHTDVNTRRVLEVGLGKPRNLYVVIEIPETGMYLARGACFSYYEFTKHIDDKLTDEEWQEMVYSGDLPEPPAWTVNIIR